MSSSTYNDPPEYADPVRSMRSVEKRNSPHLYLEKTPTAEPWAGLFFDADSELTN
jgi:hypothetical protein